MSNTMPLYMRYSNTFYDTLADKMKKQKYLIDNILNKGYDKEEFTNYMISQRGKYKILIRISNQTLISKLGKSVYTSVTVVLKRLICKLEHLSEV